MVISRQKNRVFARFGKTKIRARYQVKA